jgi:hypothetical protein
VLLNQLHSDRENERGDLDAYEREETDADTPLSGRKLFIAGHCKPMWMELRQRSSC